MSYKQEQVGDIEEQSHIEENAGESLKSSIECVHRYPAREH